MNVKPWLVGAVSVAAVTLSFGTTASATTHHIKGFRALSPSQVAPLVRRLATEGTNYNPYWAGYAAPANKNVELRYVGADFNVPSLNCANSPAGTEGPAAEVQSVGLDGYTASGYEVTGIYEQCTNATTPQYQGFYQIGNTAGSSTVAVNPGDAIQASVYYNSSTKRYYFTLNDVTTGQAVVSANAACPSGSDCANSSAEAITGVSNGLPPDYTFADYGMENFTGGAVTSRDGVHGGFSSSKLWGSVEFGIRDSSGVVEASPSSLEGGSAFSTTWHASS